MNESWWKENQEKGIEIGAAGTLSSRVKVFHDAVVVGEHASNEEMQITIW
jgi:hypothetical protein